MITSRRGFLRSLGAGTSAGMAMPWALTGTLRAATLEPYRTRQDDGFIRLNNNENAYGPSAKVAEVIKSSIGSANLIGRPFPPMDTHIRISLGRPEEMRAFWRTWDMLPYPKHSMQH